MPHPSLWTVVQQTADQVASGASYAEGQTQCIQSGCYTNMAQAFTHGYWKWGRAAFVGPSYDLSTGFQLIAPSAP